MSQENNKNMKDSLYSAMDNAFKAMDDVFKFTDSVMLKAINESLLIKNILEKKEDIYDPRDPDEAHDDIPRKVSAEKETVDRVCITELIEIAALIRCARRELILKNLIKAVVILGRAQNKLDELINN